MARAAPGSWSTMTRFFASKTFAPSEKESLRNCGMVPEPLLFQFGRYGVSLTLSRLSLVQCSTSSSHVLAGTLMPACCSIGSLYMRIKRLVKYGRPTTFEPSRRLAGRAEERASIERHGSSCSGKGGWRHEGLELALEQPREGQTREVAVLRADDLHADRQPCGREAAGRRRRRQVRHPGVAGPEQMIGHAHLRAVDDDGAIVALAVLVVREGRDAGQRAEQQIVRREE